ncbi:MAG: alpha/beta hydrolase [Myxococcota bacterium]|nr:alpha/beta hydrolase [Myxococcota bacterium]
MARDPQRDQLSSSVYGEGEASVWILHGIMGSRKNWGRFARQLSERLSGWRVRSIDLRCHGESNELPPPHSLDACVSDLIMATADWERPHAIIGHSFGGKVALLFAARSPHPLEVVWSLDSPLSASPSATQSGSEILNVLEACEQLPEVVSSRREVVDHFVSAGLSEGIGMWMTTNLTRSQEGFSLRLDIGGVRALLNDYGRVDGWSLLDQTLSRGETRVELLYASRGGRWSQGEIDRVSTLSGALSLHRLADAGHWVHIDQPEALLRLISASLSSEVQG